MIAGVSDAFLNRKRLDETVATDTFFSSKRGLWCLVCPDFLRIDITLHEYLPLENRVRRPYRVRGLRSL